MGRGYPAIPPSRLPGLALSAAIAKTAAQRAIGASRAKSANAIKGAMIFVASTLAILTGAAMQGDLSAAGPHGALSGTLTSASNPSAPVMLLIPGSGPTDRDGNNPLGINAATYRLLSADLADRGISTVRIDKRGMFASAHAVPTSARPRYEYARRPCNVSDYWGFRRIRAGHYQGARRKRSTHRP